MTKNLVTKGDTFKIKGKEYSVVGFGKFFKFIISDGKNEYSFIGIDLINKYIDYNIDAKGGIGLEVGFEFEIKNVKYKLISKTREDAYTVQTLFDNGKRTVMFKDELNQKLYLHRSENKHIFGCKIANE